VTTTYGQCHASHRLGDGTRRVVTRRPSRSPTSPRQASFAGVPISPGHTPTTWYSTDSSSAFLRRDETATAAHVNQPMFTGAGDTIRPAEVPGSEEKE
jgi:hypothetical protein